MSRRAAPRIGLALAGGGLLGAIYEIGALCALQEALPDVDFTDLDGYVGVSAGAIVAASLANGVTPRQLCTSFIENKGDQADLITPWVFYRPALGEIASRLSRLPALVAQAAWNYATGRRSVMSAVERLGRALPTGLFSNAALQSRLHSVFSAPGRTDDFRQLNKRLVLVATDLDSGEAAPFGTPGLDQVPISLAATASAALPGLFPPVHVGSRWYVDGALKKTLHASTLLDDGLDLLLCLNPLVPFDATNPERPRVLAGGLPRIPHIVDGGLPVVLSQTFRAMIRSRLERGLKGYETSHPHTDIVLLEPDQRDAELFLANLFSTAQRALLAEHAYRRTREDLRSRRSTLSATLARHGIAVDSAVLDDAGRHLLARHRRPADATLARLLKRLQEVLDDLEKALPAAAG